MNPTIPGNNFKIINLVHDVNQMHTSFNKTIKSNYEVIMVF
jgi:hypothetical protein